MFKKIKQETIERIFFVSYFIILPIISRIQYSKYFNQSFRAAIAYYFLSGIFSIIIYLVYYKLILPKLFFTSKYIWFFLSLVLFFFFSAEAIRLAAIGIDKLLYNLKFLPQDIRTAGASAVGLPFQSVSINITIYNLLSITALGYFIRALKEEQISNQIKQTQLKLELENLKSQLQPHFFFNTLNSIYSQALQHSKDTPHTISKLSDLMRYILYECDQNEVPLKQEIEFVKNYMELEQIRYQRNAKISFQLQGKTDQVFISPLLFMPLIENAFKHGINDDVNECNLSIIISIVDDELTAEIKNTKPAIVFADNNKHKGIGLQNLRKRLDLLYPQKHSLNLCETAMDFEAYLTIQLK